MAPGSIVIQQVISDSPITGWIWIPGAGENGGTSDRRTQVTLLAAPEPALASLASTVPDIFPSPHTTRFWSIDRSGWLPTCAHPLSSMMTTRRPPDGIRTIGARRFERAFLTARASTPRL